MAEWYLKKKDDEILNKRYSNLRVKDSHERILVTRFGDITVNRRYYKDKHGAYHYPGMNWTISEAQHMGKAIQLAFNGELDMWCGRNPQKARAEILSFSLFDELDGDRNTMPALTGPHTSRHWVIEVAFFSTIPI